MYLTAINGLATMGDVFPVQVIPRLMAEFSYVDCLCGAGEFLFFFVFMGSLVYLCALSVCLCVYLSTHTSLCLSSCLSVYLSAFSFVLAFHR